MGLYNPCDKILGHSVTEKLDHNKFSNSITLQKVACLRQLS